MATYWCNVLWTDLFWSYSWSTLILRVASQTLLKLNVLIFGRCSRLVGWLKVAHRVSLVWHWAAALVSRWWRWFWGWSCQIRSDPAAASGWSRSRCLHQLSRCCSRLCGKRSSSVKRKANLKSISAEFSLLHCILYIICMPIIAWLLNFTAYPFFQKKISSHEISTYCDHAHFYLFLAFWKHTVHAFFVFVRHDLDN